MPLHIDPPAAWMTPALFVAGGPIEQRTSQLLRDHGARCLRMWCESVTRFAAGAPVTARLVDQHNRQSLDHWCFARAAAYAQAGHRMQPIAQPKKTATKTASPLQRGEQLQSQARAFGWGKRGTARVQWGRR